MLKVLAVIWFLIGDWPTGQARGLYQFPPASLLPQQTISASRPAYFFGYRADGSDGGSSHQETSDGTGKVEGSYSLKVGDGRSRRVLYVADSAGFRAKVDSDEPGTLSHGPADVDFLSSTPQIVADSELDGTGGAPIQVSRSIQADSAPTPYSFHYSFPAVDGESSRWESSDGAGRVRGGYWLKVKDGGSRKVDYTADASGFKAKVDTSEPGTSGHRPADVTFYSSAADPSLTSDSASPFSVSSSPGSVLFQSAFGGRDAPSPYSFHYTVDGVDGGSSRRESSDEAGNVKGSYSLKVKDGRSRKVDYIADQEGFQATVDTNEPGTKSENPARVSFLSSVSQISPVESSAVGWMADIPASSILPPSSAYPFRLSPETEQTAKPYSFAYTADGVDGGSSRAEWSDGTGKVKGNYSLKVKDGRRRKVDYIADAGGFKATVETNEPGTKNHFPAEISFLSSMPEEMAGVASTSSIEDSYRGAIGEEKNERSYNFEYSVEGEDGASSRQETSDGKGHVKGSYSLKLKDGRNRKVDYTADDSGFKTNVNTNEPGTGNQNPADVIFHSSALTMQDFSSGVVRPIYDGLAPSDPLTYHRIPEKSVSSVRMTSVSPPSTSPYHSGYSLEIKDGGSSRQEWSDGNGNVRGSYSLNVKDGGRKKMEYTAEAGGFRARVDTNEPGSNILYSAPFRLGPPTWPLTPPHQRTGVKSWV